MFFRITRLIVFMIAGFCSLCSCDNDDKEGVVFVGDSLIRNWDVEKQFPYYNVSNLGVDGYRIEDCLDMEILFPHDKVVLLVGTNNLQRENVSSYIDSFCTSYLHLVDKIQAKHIYCISILPRTDFPSDSIRKVNDRLRSFLWSCKKVTYVNAFDDFLYENQFNPELTSDGVHLTSFGYNLLAHILDKNL